MNIDFLYENHMFSEFVQSVLNELEDYDIKKISKDEDEYKVYVINESDKLQAKMLKYCHEDNFYVMDARNLVEKEYMALMLLKSN